MTKTCQLARAINRYFLALKNENFQLKKKKKKKKKKNDIFHIFVQNIECGYTLEPPRRGGSNEYHNLCFRSKIRKIGTCAPINNKQCNNKQ